MIVCRYPEPNHRVGATAVCVAVRGSESGAPVPHPRRSAAERAMSIQQHNKKDDMTMTHSKGFSLGTVTGAVRSVHTIGAARLKQFIALIQVVHYTL